ncbi:sugar transferase [Candidatus Haliotispira prima]|uniref:Sugar transferase n=1 Tax=Candidatus Haliotispira prima TaxID=3034016 RepID=A0ABY8MFM3_9SPIO|nr:sugar transferase [Candidatus Haliotispira prima]
MKKYIHFTVNISVQSVLLILAYYRALGVYRSYFDAALNAVPMYVSFLGVFLAVYFTLMWTELYAHGVHSYLKVTTLIVGKNLGIATLAVACVIAIESVVVRDFELAAWKAIIFFGFGIVTLFGMHLLYFLWLKSLSLHGYFHKKVMLVGRSSGRFRVDKFFQDMGGTKEFCGTLSRLEKPAGSDRLSKDKDKEQVWIWDNRPTWDPDHAYRGDPKPEYYDDFMDVIYRHHIGELVIFLGPKLSEEVLQQITRACDEHAIGYYIVPDLSSLPDTRHWTKVFSYIPIVDHTTTNRDDLFNITIKRLFDIGVSFSVLLLFLPLGLLISLLIFLSDFGPVFYVSKRVGKDGQIIPFFKFRSMHKNAEQAKDELLGRNERDGDGPLFKIRNDPRVTRIGQFLRRTSLDEFPQFANVLLGHLSIIGPRPHLEEEVKHYVKRDFMRLECMQGITCLPQLHDRDHMGFHEWVSLDLYYRRNWTLGLDFYIFWKTSLLFLRSFFRKESFGEYCGKPSEESGKGKEPDEQSGNDSRIDQLS